MTYDALAALESAGISLSMATDGQREVLASLSPTEVDLVARINRRLAESGAEDVEGHAIVGVGIF